MPTNTSGIVHFPTFPSIVSGRVQARNVDSDHMTLTNVNDNDLHAHQYPDPTHHGVDTALSHNSSPSWHSAPAHHNHVRGCMTATLFGDDDIALGPLSLTTPTSPVASSPLSSYMTPLYVVVGMNYDTDKLGRLRTHFLRNPVIAQRVYWWRA
ncbi:hypothetical protein BDN72DRAFT_896418 [Pluteus cervinus]|uniref:Uncharacterized protein n=1 Tax=Pluteus cervinus TaxID=181527 RepID=A0ACD3AYT0_9AGAR|nr:hypothetical protein BDN72DRAFT_896418 [Pluteus cervinus]